MTYTFTLLSNHVTHRMSVSLNLFILNSVNTDNPSDGDKNSPLVKVNKLESTRTYVMHYLTGSGGVALYQVLLKMICPPTFKHIIICTVL